MTTKVVRVEIDCYDLIMGYANGGSATDGVRAMEKRIREVASVTEKKQMGVGVSFAVPEVVDGMPVEYWKRLKKELESFIERGQRGY